MLQVIVIVAFCVASAIYAAPSVIAIMRAHRRWALVVALNILLGWSIIGWLLALAIALGIAPRRPAWMTRTRKPRAKTAMAPPRVEAAVARPDAHDPPVIREDAYAAWLDQGAALGAETPRSNSA